MASLNTTAAMALANATAALLSAATSNTTTATSVTPPTTATATASDQPVVFFTLGKFDFSADTDLAQWLAVFLVPAIYFAVLLLVLIIDVRTCARCCARLRHGKAFALDELDTSAAVGHREHAERRKFTQQQRPNARAPVGAPPRRKQRQSTSKGKQPSTKAAGGGGGGCGRGRAAARAEAQKAYVFELVKQGRVFLGPKAMFLMHRRKYKNFQPQALELVPQPMQTLCVNYEASRRALYCTFMNTVFATALRPSIIIMCVAGLWSWSVFAFRSMVSDETLEYIDNDRDSDNSFSVFVAVSFNDTTEENIAYFLQNLDRMASLTALVQSYMSFMLVFYALQSLLLWTRTYAQMRALGVKFERMALLFSSSVPEDGEVSRRVKFTMYRYLNLLHFFMYASNVEFLLSDFKNILTRQLCRVGLLEQHEKEILDDSQFPLAALNSWITAIFVDRAQWLGSRSLRLRLLAELTETNRHYTELSVTINSSPPYSWVQLMRVLVDLYMLLTPFAFVSSMYMPQSEAQIWPVVGTFVVSMFLQGLMAFVRFLKEPFGSGRDSFNPDASLLSVERRMLFALSYVNDDPVYSPDSPQMRYRALGRAKAEQEKQAQLEAETNAQTFFGADD